MKITARSGAVTLGRGELDPGDYYVGTAKIRVDADGARLVDGDLPDGDYKIGGHYADNIGQPNFAAATINDAEEDDDDAGKRAPAKKTAAARKRPAARKAPGKRAPAKKTAAPAAKTDPPAAAPKTDK